MPEFKVHFIEKSNAGVQVESLLSFEAYGELIDVLAGASDYASRHAFKAVRVYLHSSDYERLRQQFLYRFPDINSEQYKVKSRAWGEIDVYQKNDTAQPGNAAMIIRRVV